jgi:hypothetical protein
MRRNSVFTPLGETFALLGKAPALVALAVMVVLNAANTGWFRLTVAQANSVDMATTAATIGIITVFTGLLFAVIRTVLHYRLARSLGSDAPSEIAPRLGYFIGISVVCIFLIRFWSGLAPLLFFSQVENAAAAMPLFAIALPLSHALLGALLYPIMVRLTAAAHSGNEFRLKTIWSELWTGKFGWLAIYALLVLAGTGLGWLETVALGLLPQTNGGAMLGGVLGGAIIGFSQTILLLYTVATYRALQRERGPGEASVFD